MRGCRTLLAAGDTPDFAVGFGNNVYGNDSTGLRLVAAPAVVPEPGTGALLVTGTLAVVRAVIRRRNSNRQ